MTLILFIIILGTTILVHEFGHYLFARITGVHIHEFSIGMGPKILSKESKKTKIRYSLRAVPLGGFVQLAGEEVETAEVKRKFPGKTLQDKNVFQRFLIMFFGAGFNFIFAVFMLFFIGLVFGAKDLSPKIAIVDENSPAYVAGLRAGDEVLEIIHNETKKVYCFEVFDKRMFNNRCLNAYNEKIFITNGISKIISGTKVFTKTEKVKYIDDITLYLQIVDRNQEITFKVKRENETTAREIKVKAIKEIIDGEETYRFGIGMQPETERGFFKSIKYAFQQTGSLFKQMFAVLGYLFTGKLSLNQLSGPVGIYSVVGQARAVGVSSVLYLLAYLSINVGVINLLPFPAFDGGRILFLFIEKIKGSPINPKIENIIHTIGFGLLILLIIYVTFNDIFKLF